MRLQRLLVIALLCGVYLSVPTIAGAAERAKPDTQAPAAELADMLKISSVLVLGEMHGTQETPALVGNVVSQLPKGQSWIVGLELVEEAQPEVDRFLAGQVSDAEMAAVPVLQSASRFGAYSSATLDLLKKLRTLIQSGASGRVVLFDGRTSFSSAEERDRMMANRLRAAAKASPDAKVIALTGNLHAAAGSETVLFHQLAELKPRNVLVMAPKGTYWACVGNPGEKGVCGRQVLDNPNPICAADAKQATLQAAHEVPKPQGKFDALACFPQFNAALPPGQA